jgi:hypothetical protein
MKLITWLATDTETIFGKFDPMTNIDTRTNIKIIVIGQFNLDASSYIGLSSEVTLPAVCTEITSVPVDTFYNIYDYTRGYWMTDALATSIINELSTTVTAV